jgi:DNA-directed RNA polymerase beta' subunit
MQTVNISTRKDLSDSFEKFMNGEAKGKIVLPCPVTNILKCEPVWEEIYLATGIEFDEWKDIIRHNKFVVINPGQTGFRKNTVLTPEVYKNVARHKDAAFHAGHGAEAMTEAIIGACSDKEYAEALKEADSLKEELQKVGKAAEEKMELFKEEQKKAGKTVDDDYLDNVFWGFMEDEGYSRVTQELEYYDAMINLYHSVISNKDILLLTEINIFPVELRAVMQDVSKRYPFKVSTLEGYLGRIADEANTVRRLMEENAPEFILWEAKNRLQDNVDEYFAFLRDIIMGTIKTA